MNHETTPQPIDQAKKLYKSFLDAAVFAEALQATAEEERHHRIQFNNRDTMARGMLFSEGMTEIQATHVQNLARIDEISGVDAAKSAGREHFMQHETTYIEAAEQEDKARSLEVIVVPSQAERIDVRIDRQG